MKRLILILAIAAVAGCKSGLPAAQLSASAFGVTVAIDSRPLTDGVADTVKTAAAAVGVAPGAEAPAPAK